MLTQTKSSDKPIKAQAAPSRAHGCVHQAPALQHGIGLSGVQQSAGNLAIQRLFDSGLIQAKLSISQPDDPYEQEAGQVADQVMRMPEPQLQRVCACGGACPTCQSEKHIQAKGVGSSELTEIASPAVNAALHTSGQPLDTATRGFFEPRFGTDLGAVRVHTDLEADAAARAIQKNDWYQTCVLSYLF